MNDDEYDYHYHNSCNYYCTHKWQWIRTFSSRIWQVYSRLKNVESQAFAQKLKNSYQK